MAKRELVFKTETAVRNAEEITICGPTRNGHGVRHRFAGERSINGHCPGHVCLLALANGHYKIGKSEDTKVQTDDFNLDAIDDDLLWRLKERLIGHQKDKKRPHYNEFVFLHAIRVACGEGGEKLPQVALGQRVGPGEMYALSTEDIEAFKSASGELLGRPIRHVTAEEFGQYLGGIGETRIKVDGRSSKYL